MKKERITPEQMAEIYWRKMRHGAVQEVAFKLGLYRHSTPCTIKYWLEVHSIVEAKSNNVLKKQNKKERH